MAGPPGKKLFAGAGKAPERIVFDREGGPFKPQSRAARSWDDERKGMKTGGIPGGVDEEGRADAVRRCALCRPNGSKNRVRLPLGAPSSAEPSTPPGPRRSPRGRGRGAPAVAVSGDPARRAVPRPGRERPAAGLSRPGARAPRERPPAPAGRQGCLDPGGLTGAARTYRCGCGPILSNPRAANAFIFRAALDASLRNMKRL